MKGRIEFRINQDLLRMIRINMKRKNKPTMSAYIKDLILEDDPVYHERKNKLIFLQRMQDLIFEINKIGTNINQIAKAVNEGNYYVPYHETLIMQLEQIKKCVEDQAKKWQEDLEHIMKAEKE